MISTAHTQTLTNIWVIGSWEEFVNLADNPEYEGGKFYYEQKYLKIEMPPIGSSHSQDNHIIANIIMKIKKKTILLIFNKFFSYSFLIYVKIIFNILY